MIGDVLDPHAVTTSAQGCAVVFNCARNREPDPMLQRAVDVDGADRANTDHELPIRALSPWVVKNRARRGRVSIEKARRILGYTPVVTLSHGMDLTQQWARAAGLIRSDPVYQWPASRHHAIS